LGGNRGRLISIDKRQQAIQLIDEACRAGARKSQACAILEISIRTIERWKQKKDIDGGLDLRQIVKKNPVNKLTIEQQEMVIMTANSEIYRDLPPSKIVPLIADTGNYIASESTFYRILRANKQLTHRRLSRPAKHNRPKTCVATAPNQVWSWDISYLPTQIAGMYYYLYMIVDIYSRKIVGFAVHEQENSTYAANLIKQACIDENVLENQLILHSDNGSSMKGATMLAMLEKLGVIPSFSRPAVSNDNPYSEALFRTVKYNTTFPVIIKFLTITNARQWSTKFVHWYNNEHLHSALKFVTPHQRHSGEDLIIRNKRHIVYQLAKQQNPRRWSGNTRNWDLPAFVTLNPNKNNQNDFYILNNNLLKQNCSKNIKLPEQSLSDSYGSRQTAYAVRQCKYHKLIEKF
jgi:transposase InsO family protein